MCKTEGSIYNILNVYSERNSDYFGAFLIFCCAPMSSLEMNEIMKEINEYCLRLLSKFFYFQHPRAVAVAVVRGQ